MSFAAAPPALPSGMPLRQLLVILALGAVMSAACRAGTPVIDTGPKPPTVDGTIAGQVVSETDQPLSSRLVRAVPIDGSKPYETTTNAAGTYSIKVRPGRYRLELELRQGERIVKQPGETQVNASDLDEDQNFVIGPAI